MAFGLDRVMLPDFPNGSIHQRSAAFVNDSYSPFWYDCRFPWINCDYTQDCEKENKKKCPSSEVRHCFHAPFQPGVLTQRVQQQSPNTLLNASLAALIIL